MKVGGLSPHMPNPVVDKILAPEQEAITRAEGRLSQERQAQEEYASLSGMLDGLGQMSGRMSTQTGFQKFRVESSHPDILDASVAGPAMLGSYDMEVRGLAKVDRHLEMGFAARDELVGFGHLYVDRPEGSQDLVIPPGSTLDDVTRLVNDADLGVKAQVINTGVKDEPFRLLISSVDAGEPARVSLDPDTTHLSFKQIKQAANLDLRFEDVPVQSEKNQVSDLLEGLNIAAKRAAPGTRVQLNVTHDQDQTLTDVKSLVETYNGIVGFVQAPADQEGVSRQAKSSSMRTAMRRLQSAVSAPAAGGGPYANLASVGITTDYKTGELRLDEAALKKAMAKDYDGVAKLFTVGEHGQGVAKRLQDVVRSLRDPVHGVLTTREKGLKRALGEQEQVITKQKERLAAKKQKLEQTFGQLDAKLSGLHAQQQVLSAKMGTESQEV